MLTELVIPYLVVGVACTLRGRDVWGPHQWGTLGYITGIMGWPALALNFLYRWLAFKGLTK